MQAQIQALLAAQGGVGAGGAVMGSNAGPHMEVAKPAIFNGEAGKVGRFITACRLLRKEFGGGEEESVKAAELRRMEQGGKTMEEYV